MVSLNKLALAPPAKKSATEEVEEALAVLDVTNPTKSLLDLIDRRTNAGLEKVKADMKRGQEKSAGRSYRVTWRHLDVI